MENHQKMGKAMKEIHTKMENIKKITESREPKQLQQLHEIAFTY